MMQFDKLKNNYARNSEIARVGDISELTSPHMREQESFPVLDKIALRFLQGEAAFLKNYFAKYELSLDKATVRLTMVDFLHELEANKSIDKDNMLVFSFLCKNDSNSDVKGHIICGASFIYQSIEYVFGNANANASASDSGAEDKQEKGAFFTNLERNFALNFMNNFLNAFKLAIESLHALNFYGLVFNHIGENSLRQLNAENKFYVISLIITVNELNFPLYIMLPSSWLQVVQNFLGQASYNLNRTCALEWREHMQEFLLDLELLLQAKLTGFKASLRDLLVLQKGDVLLCDSKVEDGILLQVANTTIGSAELGRLRDNMAVSVLHMAGKNDK